MSVNKELRENVLKEIKMVYSVTCTKDRLRFVIYYTQMILVPEVECRVNTQKNNKIIKENFSNVNK